MMAGIVRTILSSKLSWIPVGVALAWLGYKAFGPTKYSVETELTDLADRVVARAVEDVPRKEGLNRLAVLNFRGDRAGYIAEELRKGINRTGKYEVVSTSLYEKLAAEFKWQTDDYPTLEAALEKGCKIGCDAVVFGEIGRFARDQQGAGIEMIVRAADVKSGAAFFIKDYADGTSKNGISLRSLQSRMRGMSFGLKLLIWLLFTVFLPIATFFVPRAAFRQESNFLNFTVLLGYTLIDFLFALLMTGFRASGFWNALLLILALGLGAVYNYLALSKIEEFG